MLQLPYVHVDNLQIFMGTFTLHADSSTLRVGTLTISADTSTLFADTEEKNLFV